MHECDGEDVKTFIRASACRDEPAGARSCVTVSKSQPGMGSDFHGAGSCHRRKRREDATRVERGVIEVKGSTCTGT
jgi:hypothetical protein